jgi:PAS domain S-box-containing protein
MECVVDETAPSGWHGANNSKPSNGDARESKELRAFIDQVPALGWSALPDGSLEYVNQRFRDYTGLSPDELCGSGWKSAVHRDDIQPLERWSQELLQSWEAGTTEVRLCRFDGSYRWFLVFANPLRDESGSVVAWYGTNIDIEDRKRAEATLRARELSWLQIVDNIPGLVATMGATGEVEFLNRQTLEYFGKSTDDLKNWALSDAVHPDDLPRIIQARIKSIEEGGIYHVEHRCRRADGVYRWFQVRGIPVRDAEDTITAWYLLLTDIDDRKRAERELQRSEAFLAKGQRISQTGSFSWSVATDEIAWSEELYLIFEFDTNLPVTLERITSRVHPDDLQLMQDMIERMRHAAADDFEYEYRLLMHDHSIKHIHLFAHPVHDKDGRLEFIGAVQDVTRQRLSEKQLQESELNLRRITQIIPGVLWSATPEGELDYCNRPTLDFTGMTAEQAKGWGWTAAIYPDDRDSLIERWRSCLASGTPYDTEARVRRFDGAYRWFLFRANPLRDESGKIVKWYGTSADIEDSKRREEVLRASELSWRQLIDNIPGFVTTTGAMGEVQFFNQQTLEYFGKTPEELRDWTRIGIVHPDDLPHEIEAFTKSLETGQILDIETRLRRADGVYRWFQTRSLPVRNAEGTVTSWNVLLTDIDDRKRAEEKVRQSEEKLRQSEAELRTITDTVRQPIMVLAPDGTILYANRVALDDSGLTLDEVIKEGFLGRLCHSDGINRVRDEHRIGLMEGVPFDVEMRLLHKSGEYRWQLLQYNPLKDESGQIIRWYATATDIDDQKWKEERLRNENVKLAQERVYLEEQIRSEMGFEEIIGNSSALKHVLELVETVAPSDSTVLLLGETGTGKELIARAVHERSRRKAKTFVKLNCAAIPTGLLESELFGHEKGAFTGAINQKVGRMELADQGTLFLDEVGDIPTDIQPKLLRVLQEREFERLGSTHTRRVNVRLVAATNRNLKKMVADREFRSDLYYRLNVFPIRIPPLRDRKDDIPLLAVYFVQKFAKQMQKRIDSIPVATMNALTAWEWPGNIRELENFIERAVILTRGKSLAVPLSELSNGEKEELARESVPREEDDIAGIVKETIASLKRKRLPRERIIMQHDEICRVLKECKGRVGGADGAAARLGLSRTTLISRMKKLGIKLN